MGAATGRAGSVSAFRAFCGMRRVVDMFWCYPGTAGWLGAVDSVASWDGPFCFALVIFFCCGSGEVGKD